MLDPMSREERDGLVLFAVMLALWLLTGVFV